MYTFPRIFQQPQSNVCMYIRHCILLLAYKGYPATRCVSGCRIELKCFPLNFLYRWVRNFQGRRNEGRAKGGNADGKGNFGLMNNSFNVVDINPQISSIQHYLSVR